jgi:hypothetical protein
MGVARYLDGLQLIFIFTVAFGLGVRIHAVRSLLATL